MTDLVAKKKPLHLEDNALSHNTNEDDRFGLRVFGYACSSEVGDKHTGSRRCRVNGSDGPWVEALSYGRKIPNSHPIHDEF